MRHERLFTVGELAKRCGVTVRTLQYYDKSGLLTPSRYTEGGRRLYGIDDVLRLQQILFFKGFGFGLEEIRERLLPISSPKDFADILLRQKKVIKKQIEYLEQSSALIDKTVEEISSNKEVSMEMIAAILSATKQGNFFSFVMKYFKEEELKALMEKADSETPDHEWQALMARLKELHKSDTDPLGEQGQKLASDWWDRVMALTGGDPALIESVIGAGSEMNNWPQEMADVKSAMEEFLSPAMGKYFVDKGIAVPGMEDLNEQ